MGGAGPCIGQGTSAWPLKLGDQGHVDVCVDVNGCARDVVYRLVVEDGSPIAAGTCLSVSLVVCPCADSPFCSSEAGCVCSLTCMHVSAPAGLLPGPGWLWGGAQRYP